MNKSHYATVISSRAENGVRTITLNRPDVLNAMNRQLVDDVATAFNDANADAATSVIIFTGAGRSFCAGDDRNDHVHPESEAAARDFVDAIQNATRAIVMGEKPVIGVINGWAVGGGFEWALNCDFSIWAKSAKAFFPEVSLNLFVTGAVTSILPALVGLNKAREMLMFGQQYSARELLDCGAAWRVENDEQLIEAAEQVAGQLAEQPARSLRTMKRALNAGALTDIERALQVETDFTVAGFLDPLTTKKQKAFSRRGEKQ